MLDKQTSKMLENLFHLCGDGSYKVIDTNDLIRGMLPKYSIDVSIVSHQLKFLADNGMVDIKYSDDKVYCVAVLPKGRVFIENKDVNNAYVRFSRRLAGVAIFGSFLAAFLGAFIAGLI